MSMGDPLGIPNSWMVNNWKSHWNGWFGGTPMYGTKYTTLIHFVDERLSVASPRAPRASHALSSTVATSGHCGALEIQCTSQAEECHRRPCFFQNRRYCRLQFVQLPKIMPEFMRVVHLLNIRTSIYTFIYFLYLSMSLCLANPIAFEGV